MPHSVNFVRERQRLLTKTQLQDQKVLKIVSMITGGLFLVFVVVMGVQLFLTYRLAQLQTRYKGLVQAVGAQDATERSFLILTNKLRVLAGLMAARSDKQAAIAFFTTVFGEDVTIKDLKYEAEGGVIAFGVETKDIFTLERVTRRLGEEDVHAQFTNVTVNELRRGNAGQYTVTVTVALKGAKKDQPAAPASTTVEEELGAE